MNLIKANQKSVTISIPKAHTEAWIEILNQTFGTPINQTMKGNGLQFKTISGVSIKIWDKKSSTKNTILIDGPRDKYLSFVDNEMTNLFEKVLEICSKNTGLNKNSNLRKRRLSNKSINCNLCNFEGNKMRMKIHVSTTHSINNRRKSVKSIRAVLPRKTKSTSMKRKLYKEVDESFDDMAQFNTDEDEIIIQNTQKETVDENYVEPETDKETVKMRMK